MHRKPSMQKTAIPSLPAIKLPEQVAQDATYCLVHEAIVGTFGLPPGKLFTSIKGDPSLRETAPQRPRQPSRIDKVAGQVLDACAYLLSETGVYAIYIGFNSSEVRTESIFNTFSYEIHDAELLVQPDYLERHFIAVPYAEKMRTVAWIRNMVQTGPLRNYLPRPWRKVMDEQRMGWRPPPRKSIHEIVNSLNTLRGIEGYYLRNAAISLSQGIVRASFNCDGTYIVKVEHFAEFVRQNTP